MRQAIKKASHLLEKVIVNALEVGARWTEYQVRLAGERCSDPRRMKWFSRMMNRPHECISEAKANRGG